MPRRLPSIVVIAALVVLATVSVSQADVLIGVIDHQPESLGVFTWGDGVNDLYQSWSVNDPNASGWFYGLNYPWSNCDVYAYLGFTDPTSVTDASTFAYTSGSAWAYEGSTIFFRGANGYYGAWVIEDIHPGEPGDPAIAYLDGVWYFVTDQSADFSQGTVATETRTLSAVKRLFR